MIEGLPLGVIAEATYRLTEFWLEPSDRLIFMSDGLPERLNDEDELFGYAPVVAEIRKVGQTVQSAQDVLEAVVRAGNEWENNTPQNDDVTFIVLK